MKKLGLIGHPVGHSMSQIMHEKAFQQLGLDAEYQLYDVVTEELSKFIDDAKNDFSGLNATIPHKVEVMKYLDEISEEAELIGAVNTIKFTEGKSKGYNTDGVGFIKSLLDEDVSVKDKKIFVLGAGGAARALCFQTVIEGGNLIITNRQSEIQMAVDLADEIEDKTKTTVEVFDFNEDELKKAIEKADILVNATPVGMKPNIEDTIIPTDWISKKHVVVDIVYNPIETRFLSDCSKIGCKTISGVGMLVYQGVEALKIWLDIDAPVDLMKKAVISKLQTK